MMISFDSACSTSSASAASSCCLNNNGDSNRNDNSNQNSSNNSNQSCTMPDRDFNYTPRDAADRAVAKGGVACPFPWRLHEMLKVSAEEGLEHIVSWAPHGKAFTVHKPQEFADSIMTRFFCQTKYASFQRQLNLYGFARFCHGRDKGAYYHPCFIRGQRALVRQMIRRKIKGSASCLRRPLPTEEPNFYDSDNEQQQQLQQQAQSREQSQSLSVPSYISYNPSASASSTSAFPSHDANADADASESFTRPSVPPPQLWNDETNTRNVSFDHDGAVAGFEIHDEDLIDDLAFFGEGSFHLVMANSNNDTNTHNQQQEQQQQQQRDEERVIPTPPVMLDPASALEKLRNEIRQKQAEYEQTVGQRYAGPLVMPPTTTPTTTATATTTVRRVSWQQQQQPSKHASPAPTGNIPVYKGSYISV